MIKIGGEAATVPFAGLVRPGEYQFNVIVPSDLADGDQPVVATYNGASTQAGAKIRRRTLNFAELILRLVPENNLSWRRESK